MLGGACGATVPMANPLDRIRHAIPPFDRRRLGDSRYRRQYEADLLMQRRWLGLFVEQGVAERQALRVRLAELLTPGHRPVGTASPFVSRRDVEVRLHEVAVLLRAAQSTLTTIRREVAGLKEIRRIAQFDSVKAKFSSSAVSPLIPGAFCWSIRLARRRVVRAGWASSVEQVPPERLIPGSSHASKR